MGSLCGLLWRKAGLPFSMLSIRSASVKAAGPRSAPKRSMTCCGCWLEEAPSAPAAAAALPLSSSPGGPPGGGCGGADMPARRWPDFRANEVLTAAVSQTQCPTSQGPCTAVFDVRLADIRCPSTTITASDRLRARVLRYTERKDRRRAIRSSLFSTAGPGRVDLDNDG